MPSAPGGTGHFLLRSLGIERPRRIALFLALWLLAGLLSGLPDAHSLAPAPRRALFILLVAAGLWMTDVVPAFAVGILVMGLEITLLGRPGGVFAKGPRDWEQFVQVLGHPLIWLFFGGFVLAAGLANTGLDRRLAARVLQRLGGRPRVVLLGVMGLSFGFSMFVSNTATAVMMLAMTAPLARPLAADDPFRVALPLGVAVAANLGGMGSLIGTPPNGIAAGVLLDLTPPVSVSFLQWMAFGLPPALLLLAGATGLLHLLYPPARARIPVDLEPAASADSLPVPPWMVWTVGLTVALTIALWLTTQWTGLPTTLISFLPIVAFTTSGVLGVREVRGLPYDVLFLMAGGLALGKAITATGLGGWIVAQLPLAQLGPSGTILLVTYAVVLLSNFMSNTAAANVMVPIGVGLASASPAQMAIPLALGASCAMCLPVSTPPNALASAGGQCGTRDFLRVGLPLSLLTPPLAVAWVHFVASRIF